jgi:hypothetical protein
MTSVVINSSSIDISGKQLLWGDAVKCVHYYSTSGEAWSRARTSTTWYNELTLPTDNFYGSTLDGDKWSFFNYRGTISGSVDDKLRLFINEKTARGGVTSNGKWKLSGDFDVRVYLDESSYYNEYRGESATGLTISIDDSNKVRTAKYFDGDSIGYTQHYIYNIPLKYYTWFDNGGLNTSVGEDSVTCVRVVRSGSTINSYVSDGSGFVSVGSGLSGSVWSLPADVEIEVETEQYNSYGTDILGIVVSGTITPSVEFSSTFRGAQKEFPENSLMLVDSDGLSIINEDDRTLWMRFIKDDSFFFTDSDTSISAVNGKVFMTSASGLRCFDFVKDKAYQYVDGVVLESVDGLASRNFKTTWTQVGTNSFLTNNNVLDVSAKYYDGHEYVFAATASGIGVVIDGCIEKTGPAVRTQLVRVSDGGNLFWNEYSVDSSIGNLSYRESISNLLSLPGDTFACSGYYDTSTSPVSLSSVDLNDVYISDSSFGCFVSSNIFGIDFVNDFDRITYGPVNVINPVLDPSFESGLGMYWKLIPPTSLFPIFDVRTTSEWYTVGGSSLRMSSLSLGYTAVGYYGGVYQEIDFGGVDKIYFDLKIIGNSTNNYSDLVVMIDSTAVATFSDISGSCTKLNYCIDVSSYTSTHTLYFMIKSKYEGLCSLNASVFYIDNIRSVLVTPDYPIIPTTAHEVLEALLIYGADKKIFFSTRDGFGAIDLDTNTLDFFTEVVGIVPLTSVVTAEYTEVLDGV